MKFKNEPISTFLHVDKNGESMRFGIFEIFDTKILAAPANDNGWEKPLKYNGYHFTIRGKRCYLKQFKYGSSE
jgi:hypothetical protein